MRAARPRERDYSAKCHLGRHKAIKVHPLQDQTLEYDLLYELNYVYGSALAAGTVPYGTKGFIVMHKGGDGAVFKEGQATLAGWGGAGNEVTFQNAVAPKLARLLELSPLVILRSRYNSLNVWENCISLERPAGKPAGRFCLGKRFR